MQKEFLFIVNGYLVGSVLFARVASSLLNKPAVIEESKDGNPGTANAFQYGGLLCGLITLCGDLCKGFFPIQLYLSHGGDFITAPLLSAMVLASPVLGHAFPLFYRFHGGKGIAVTFGVLMGLFPAIKPLLVYASLFLLFSLVIRITPHFYRTSVTYMAALPLLLWEHCECGVVIGFLFITATVCIRLHMSNEKREEMRVTFLWTH